MLKTDTQTKKQYNESGTKLVPNDNDWIPTEAVRAILSIEQKFDAK